ncbi:hypothetical protein GOP47_0013304 [Adiantum capillus-veneris]|uniref:Uncharacterized protein n=1 Tax=Adiantum capillus-veneris TaxID=13818 RepID=A0A9D4UN88_ADICA|nr:hypothetical protein GOP47_0013304 [Adiantum capillus-veneris]
MAHHETPLPSTKASSPSASPHESPSHEEPLPPLLQFITDDDYACIGGSPSSPLANFHSTIDISELDQHASAPRNRPHHNIELSKVASSPESSSTDISQPSAHSLPSRTVSAIDIPELANDALHRSPMSSTPKSEKVNGGAAVPFAPRGFYGDLVKKVSFTSKTQGKGNQRLPANGDSTHGGSSHVHKSPPMQDPPQKVSKRKFFSQPMPTREKMGGGMRTRKGSVYSGPVRRCSTHVGSNQDDATDNAKKANYVMFKTRSNKFDKPLPRTQSQDSRRGGDDPSNGSSSSKSSSEEAKAVPAGRYFDALRGPELEFVKDSEELLLPLNQKWPFLLRFPIGCFGICLGLGSQAVLYKVLATLPSTSFLKIPLVVNFVLWCLALIALVVISIIYGLKCLLYFEAVRREYYHPVRVNFFFAPWIACMFLTLGIPPRIGKSIHPAIWCIFTTPLLLLKLKIYGQWLSGGQRRLSKVANPSTHLSLVGNFVSAMLAAVVGWDEPAIFFWAVGCAHYLVVFVTLYQRLPTAEVLPKELHPVFFLFVAAPSVASVAWKNIVGSFDRVSRVAYFLALFLYSSLVVRINFFRGFQFSVTWWAYTFPMTASAIATINYAVEVRHPITQVKGNLLPNDVAIAITRKRHKRKQKGSKVDPLFEKMSKEDEDDSTKLFLASEGGTIVASLENGLISFTSDPFPVCANATESNASQIP